MTGGSRGIGRALALDLAARGWKVAIQYATQEDAAREVQAELGGQSAGIYRAELLQPNAASELFATVVQDGPLDALVNNAGVYRPISWLTADEDAFVREWEETMQVNVHAPLQLMRRAALHFAEQGHGKILNVASRVGFRGEPNAAFYAASKAALINLTRSLAVELAPKNIQVMGIAPGWVETAMAREGMRERLDTILEGIPLRRMATPEDCAATGAFLLSDEAAYLSGVVIDINGASYFH